MRLKDIEKLEDVLKQYKTFITQENIDDNDKRLVYKAAVYDSFKIKWGGRVIEFTNTRCQSNTLNISLDTEGELYGDVMILHTKDIVGFDIKIDLCF